MRKRGHNQTDLGCRSKTKIMCPEYKRVVSQRSCFRTGGGGNQLHILQGAVQDPWEQLQYKSSEDDCPCTRRYHSAPKYNALWWTIFPPTCSSPSSLLFVLNQLKVSCTFSPGQVCFLPNLYSFSHFCLTRISTLRKHMHAPTPSQRE